MRKVFIILGLIAAIIATILSVTKFSNLAVTPIIIAFISGLIILFLSNKSKTKTKTIQYIFLLVIISMSLTIYKAVAKAAEIEAAEQRSEENLKDSEVIENTEEIEEINDNSEID